MSDQETVANMAQLSLLRAGPGVLPAGDVHAVQLKS
jgi:hypothetical protein